MKEKVRFLGLDVHAETIAVAVAEPVSLKHEIQCFLQKREVIFAKACLLCERSVEEAVAAIEAIGDTELAANGALLVDVLFVCNCATRNRELSGDNRIDTAGKRELQWAANLTAVHIGRHHCAKGANVKEV